jgi:hypothetical protein
MLLVGREVVLLAVDRPARGREEDLPDAPLAGRFGQIQAPQDVHVGIEDGVFHRAPHVHLSRMVDEDLDPRLPHQLRRLLGPHVQHMQLRPLRHVLPPSPRQIVEDQHPAPLGKEGTGHMGTDEPGSPRNADSSLVGVVLHSDWSL